MTTTLEADMATGYGHGPHLAAELARWAAEARASLEASIAPEHMAS